MDNIKIIKSENLKSRPDENNLGFGSKFTDYMFIMDYNPEQGWHDPRIEPYSNLELDPATMFLHYGQGVFEGLKAYVTNNNTIQLFRPEENINRLYNSCKKLCIPVFDKEFALDALKQLVLLDKEWIPRAEGTSLYIRPVIISTDPYLGVRASQTYKFFIILSPVGAYYPEGFNPIKIWVTKNHVRAVRGGLGEAKTPGNYAASLYAGEEAHKKGYSQVLWLDGIEQKYVEEVGSMNIFFVIDDEIITPELNGSILPGVTRDSVIKLLKYWKKPLIERKISIDEVIEAHGNKKYLEVFGTGTAAVISPVGLIKYGENEYVINDGKVGKITQELYDEITDIQYGRKQDILNWIQILEK